MPKVDMDMASGKIASWFISEGDTVTKGEPLFEIETDKAAMEVEAPADGILHHRAPEGAEIAIGMPCAWLYAEGEEITAQPASTSTPVAMETASPEPEPVPEPVGEAGTQLAPQPGKTRATPRARSLAAEHGIDIAALNGSGPRGRVQAQDVPADLKGPADTLPAEIEAETGPLSITRSRGGTGEPLVMIHGFTSDGLSWAPLEAQLKSRPVIRIELPSHGKSPKRSVSSFADLVKELRHAFDGLGVSSAHLVGHSLGGAISLALADTRPKSVLSLTLIAPAGLGPEINGAALSGILNATRPESLAPWLRQLVADEGLITPSYARLAMAARHDPGIRAAQRDLAERLFPDGVQAFDLRAALDRVAPPTRIIWGKSDAIIPWRQAERAPGRVALHLFDRIGHMPQIECPEDVARIIARPV